MKAGICGFRAQQSRTGLFENTMRSNPFIPGLLSALPRQPEQVALVCASRIGDYLCATPAIRALKARLPRAEFTLIALPFVREMAERNRNLEAFEPFPGFPGIAEQFFDARAAVAFFERMQRKRFDLAVQMHGSGVFSNTFTLMLGAGLTAGFVRKEDGPGRLDAALPWPASLHAALRALALAEFLGAPRQSEGCEFGLLPGDHAAASGLLRECKQPLIGLHPWAREEDKQWPADRFAAAGIALRNALGGTLVILGGPREGPAGEQMTQMTGLPAVNLAGRESIAEMGAVIARLAVLITNDSGPAHIAYALSAPTVTLFGKTDPHEWGPPERPIHKTLRAPDCRLSSIGIDAVVKAAMEAAVPIDQRSCCSR